MMFLRCTTYAVLLTFAGLGWSSAQNAPSADTAQSQQNTPPAPAYGQANPSVMSPENPPVSAVDAASLDLKLQPKSMLAGGVVASESLDTNANENLNSQGGGTSVTRLLGGLTMQRLWKRYDFAAAYIGGVGFYPSVAPTVRNLQEGQAQQAVSWKTGQLTVRDSFSYLPEGSFGGGSFGGASGFTLGLGGLGEGSGLPGLNLGGHYGVLGSTQYGSLGQSPRITNVAIADVVQQLSPVSAFTAAGSFGVVHFTDGNPSGLINSSQVGTEVGYSHAVSRRDQVGIVYGFREFFYPSNIGAGNVISHILPVLYGHRVSSRMDFVAGVGPQWTIIESSTTNPGGSSDLSVAARVSLHYRFPKTSTGLSYQHLNTAGSGFYAGAESDIARASATRELARRLRAIVDAGFSRNHRLQTTNGTQGVNSDSFNYFFAGAGINRAFNRNVGAFLSYQYNGQVLNGVPTCRPGVPCNNSYSRQVVTFGVDWYFRPIRLD